MMVIGYMVTPESMMMVISSHDHCKIFSCAKKGWLFQKKSLTHLDVKFFFPCRMQCLMWQVCALRQVCALLKMRHRMSASRS